MSDWREVALAVFTADHMVDPSKIVAKVEGRAEAASWIAWPTEPGNYLSYDGSVFSITSGSWGGERAIYQLIKSGPFLRIPDQMVDERPAIEAREKVDKLTALLAQVHELSGVES